MVAPNLYTSRFANQYGEEWEFEYDPIEGEGVVRGSDVDWKEYRVVGGRALGLVMNNEEILWLRMAWAKAIAVQAEQRRSEQSLGGDSGKAADGLTGAPQG